MNKNILYDIYEHEGLLGVLTFWDQKNKKGKMPPALVRHAFVRACEQNDAELINFLKPFVSNGLQASGACVLFAKKHWDMNACLTAFGQDVFLEQEHLLMTLLEQERVADALDLLAKIKRISPDTLFFMVGRDSEQVPSLMLDQASSKVHWGKEIRFGALQNFFGQSSLNLFSKTLRSLSTQQWFARRKLDIACLCLHLRDQPEKVRLLIPFVNEELLRKALQTIVQKKWSYYKIEKACESVFMLAQRHFIHQNLDDIVRDKTPAVALGSSDAPAPSKRKM